MSEGLMNAFALGRERIEKVKKFQGQSTHPLFDWVMNQKDNKRLSDLGLRIALKLAEDGGETFFTYADASFRNYIAPEYDAMRVYPSRFAKSIELNGDFLRMLKEGNEDFFLKWQEKLDDSANASKKILSRHFHGNGTGTVAVALNTISSTGTQTLQGVYTTGGTSGQAKTKGTAWLKKNESYQAINPSTEAVRGTFTVLTEGRRTCSINLVSGTISANDYIVQTGSWKKVPVGLRNLASFENRVVQNYNTANAPNLNTPFYDNGGNPISPAAFSLAKGLIQAFTNDEGEEKGKMIVMTPGHQKTLVNQAFQYRQYVNPKGDMTVYGVFSKYVDMDGDIHFIDADAPDEQIRILAADAYSVGEDMPWGFYDDDGLQIRMKHGTNLAGSDTWFLSFGWQGNMIKKGVALCDAVIDDVAHSGADYAVQAYG